MTANDNGRRVPAQTIGELDVHLSYLQEAVKAVDIRLGDMATKRDIEAITDQMEHFATKAELKALQDRVEGITPKSLMANIRDFFLTVAAGGAFIGVVVALVRWLKP